MYSDAEIFGFVFVPLIIVIILIVVWKRKQILEWWNSRSSRNDDEVHEQIGDHANEPVTPIDTGGDDEHESSWWKTITQKVKQLFNPLISQSLASEEHYHPLSDLRLRQPFTLDTHDDHRPSNDMIPRPKHVIIVHDDDTSIFGQVLGICRTHGITHSAIAMRGITDPGLITSITNSVRTLMNEFNNTVIMIGQGICGYVCLRIAQEMNDNNIRVIAYNPPYPTGGKWRLYYNATQFSRGSENVSFLLQDRAHIKDNLHVVCDDRTYYEVYTPYTNVSEHAFTNGYITQFIEA